MSFICFTCCLIIEWVHLTNIYYIYIFVSIELGQSLSDFGKAVKLLGACEGNSLGIAFSELGAKAETLSVKLQKEVVLN
jgi:hypothetical protein